MIDAHRMIFPGQSLNSVMEFDHVIRVADDGTVSDAPEVYAPEMLDDTVSDGWTLLDGYSCQYGYAGPTMHPSELIGGRMATDILSTPGLYVALISYLPEDLDEPVGWAVARRNVTDTEV